MIENVGKNVGKNVGRKYTQLERRNQIINLLKKDSSLTITLLSEKLHVSPKTIERDLNNLNDKVRYVGSSKKGYWEVFK
jgi:predicted DNA-binding transcriptional regulator YafY